MFTTSYVRHKLWSLQIVVTPAMFAPSASQGSRRATVKQVNNPLLDQLAANLEVASLWDPLNRIQPGFNL